MTSFEFLTCLGLISVSAFLSLSEVGLFSLSRFQLRSLKEHPQSGLYRKIKRLLGDPGGLLISILVLNEMINILLSAIIAGAVSRSGLADIPPLTRIPSWIIDSFLGTLITAPIVLFACEVTPKIVGAKASPLVATVSAGPMNFLYDALKPVRWALSRLVSMIAKRVGSASPSSHAEKSEGGKEQPILKESDFLSMLEEGHKEGAILESEMELIRKVFELDDTTAEEICTPISEVHTLPAQTLIKTALLDIREKRHSRIPLLGANRRVAGVLFSKDLLRAKLDPELLGVSVSAVMRRPLFVRPDLRVSALFRKFKQERTHLAVVQTATGETIGVVTMSDVLESLFGEILGEGDEE